MGTERMEAFSDGVLAIIITIMVLELKVPHGTDMAALWPLVPVLLSYLLSFIYIGIYWNNHHHMLRAAQRINGAVMWANLHLLFWLSLVPFVTGWMGENHFAPLPTAAYGVILLMCALAYWLLQRAIMAEQENALLVAAVGNDFKGKLSPFLYFIAIVMAFFEHWVAQLIYAVVAVLWLIPDRRIEHAIEEEQQPE